MEIKQYISCMIAFLLMQMSVYIFAFLPLINKEKKSILCVITALFTQVIGLIY